MTDGTASKAADKASDAAGQAKDGAQDAAKNVQSSKAYQVLVKVGLTAYGIIHLLVAGLIVKLALGDSSGETSNTGAIAEVAKAPAGEILLGVIGVGLYALVVWQVIAAIVGFPEFEESKRLRKRISAVGRAVIYGALGTSAIMAAIKGASSSGGGETEEEAAKGLFGLPGGVFLVGIAGLAVIGYGIYQGYRGVKAKFNEELETELRGAGRAFATAGHIGKGAAFVAIGGLFVLAAIRHNPDEAGGMDQALQALRGQPFGVVILFAIALGIGCFGIWCFYWAKHAKHA